MRPPWQPGSTPGGREASTEPDYDHSVDLGDLNLTYGKIAQHIPQGARVLDVGCATGSFGLALQAERSCRVTGIEVDPEAAAKARSRGLEVLLADVQSSRLAETVGGRQFDVIVLADVLEHLMEPRALLVQLHEVLAGGGRVLVSVPNITHVDIQLMLAQDDFRYRSSGLLDRTHLRFFSLGTFSEMAFACGFDITASEKVVIPCLGTEVLDFGRGLRLPPDRAEELRRLVGSLNENFETYQHVLRLEPAPERAPAAPAGEASRAPGRPLPSLGLSRPAVDVVVLSGPGRADLTATLLHSLGGQLAGELQVTVVVPGGDEPTLQELRRAVAAGPPAPPGWRALASGQSRGEALNAGLDQAGHDYLALWTDDDSPAPGFLARLVEVLEAHPWVTAAIGSLRVAEGEHDGSSWRHLADVRSLAGPFDRLRMLGSEPVGLSSVLFRVSALRRLRLRFDESPAGYPEWTFLASVAAASEMEMCAPALMTTFVHPARLAPVPGESGPEHLRLLERAAQRDGPLPVRMQRQEVRSAIARLDRLAEELRAQGERSQRELLATQEQLNRVLASRSWKLTRGLRRLTGSRLPR